METLFLETMRLYFRVLCFWVAISFSRIYPSNISHCLLENLR